jgi:hypothetical protein
MKYFTKIYRMAILLSVLMVSCNDSSQPTQSSTTTPFAKPPTVTPIPSATLYPILNSENANELVFQLLKDNSNCHLSCWWGIIPTTTTSQDAISFLNSFSSIASRNSLENEHGSMRLQIPNGRGFLSPFVEYDSIDGIVDSLVVGISQLAKNENGGYEEVHDDPAFATAVQLFMLPEILKFYGQPKEVLISTYSLQPLRWPVLFDIQLFYPEHGFLIVYHSVMEFSRNGFIKGCPSTGNISIGLWKPEKYLSMNDLPENIRNNISSFSLSSYLQIDEVTNMNIQDFYDTFKDDNGTLCLETPSNIWPLPGQ